MKKAVKKKPTKRKVAPKRKAPAKRKATPKRKAPVKRKVAAKRKAPAKQKAAPKRKSRPPSVPAVVVELGRAVELMGTEHAWAWNVRDNWIVCSNAAGTKLFLFKRPTEKATVDHKNEEIIQATNLYGRFNRRDSNKGVTGGIRNLQRKAGRVAHVVYNSNKFGGRSDYIHTFRTPPIIWVDRIKRPTVIAITGGNIRTTRRGIEG